MNFNGNSDWERTVNRLISYSFCVLVAGLVFYAFSPRGDIGLSDGQLDLSRVQINDMIRLEKRIVAVGERGTIVISEDNGISWSQTHKDEQLPVTLTDISQVSGQTLIAVGHDNVILRSDDGGHTWIQVMRDSELGEPLLGSWSKDGEEVFVFGSFGKFYVSHDGGKTFDSRDLPIYGEHLSAMDGNGQGGRILVGEMGLVLRSEDSGESWQKLDPFYDGSLFGVAHLMDDRWIAYGMRGNVFFTSDNGDQWTPVDVPHKLPLYGHTLVQDGEQIIIVGTAGTYVTVNNQGELLGTGSLGELGTLTSAVVLPSGELLVGGQRGLTQSITSFVAALN